MRQMVEVFEQHEGPVVAVHQVPRDEISAYGVIDGAADPEQRPRSSASRDMVEKPRAEDAPSDLAIIGRYILTPDIFDDAGEDAARQGRARSSSRTASARWRQRARLRAIASRACATTPATSSGS